MSVDQATADELNDWLPGDRVVSRSGEYGHHLVLENQAVRDVGLSALKRYADAAIQDAKDHMLVPPEDTLDPLGELRQPYEGFPGRLDSTALQGYLGEVLAGVTAECLGPFLSAWEVPAFLFRFHEDAFNLLARVNQTGERVTPIPGRKGNDCLAFILDDKGKIAKALVCEAKCSAGHSSSHVRNAHTQISSLELIPVSTPKLIEVLKERNDPQSARWVAALQDLWWRGPGPDYERYDLVVYVCGKRPRRSPSWIGRGRAHDRYKAKRHLEACEIQLTNIPEVITRVFGA